MEIPSNKASLQGEIGGLAQGVLCGMPDIKFS